MIECPECGETDDLRGERQDDVIGVTCGACGHAWTRDLNPRCPTCGGDDLLPITRAVVERSRGTQLSVTATANDHLCRSCDAEAVAVLAARPGSGRLVMPGDLPTSSGDA